MSSQLKASAMHQMTTSILPMDSTLREKWQPSLIDRNQTIDGRHLCPCCANVLLRHIRSNKLYWRCGHCCQVMPVLEDSVTFIT
jgi:hypothetical protein